jgi:hypothetical protein
MTKKACEICRILTIDKRVKKSYHSDNRLRNRLRQQTVQKL